MHNLSRAVNNIRQRHAVHGASQNNSCVTPLYFFSYRGLLQKHAPQTDYNPRTPVIGLSAAQAIYVSDCFISVSEPVGILLVLRRNCLRMSSAFRAIKAE